MGRLDNKIAMITGGASGMGAAMAKLFAQEGATVIAADINEDNLAKISELDNVEGMKLDVSSDENWAEVTKAIVEKYGRIDILINNAGISSEKDQIKLHKRTGQSCIISMPLDLSWALNMPLTI